MCTTSTLRAIDSTEKSRSARCTATVVKATAMLVLSRMFTVHRPPSAAPTMKETTARALTEAPVHRSPRNNEAATGRRAENACTRSFDDLVMARTSLNSHADKVGGRRGALPVLSLVAAAAV